MDPSPRIHKRLLESLEGLPPHLILAVSFLLVGLIAFLSYEVHVEVRFSFFYLVPISLGSWFVSRRAGILLALLSALSWLGANLAEGGFELSRDSLLYWNTGLLLVFFLVMASLLSTLRETLEREKVLARRDPLTNLFNRLALFEAAEIEIRRSARYNRPLTVGYIDIDGFKRVNYRYGHAAGDKLLQLVAETIRKGIRATDVVGRIGGDEFVVLLPESESEAAEVVFRKMMEALPSATQDSPWPVTFSVGVLTLETSSISVDEMIRMADELMYSAKKKGKNMLHQRTIRRMNEGRAQ